MKRIIVLGVFVLSLCYVSCSNDDGFFNRTENVGREVSDSLEEPFLSKWRVVKENYTAGNTTAYANYVYNSNGKVAQIKFYYPQNTLQRTQTFTYDANNYLVKWEEDYVDPAKIDERDELENDAQGRPIANMYFLNNVLKLRIAWRYEVGRTIQTSYYPSGSVFQEVVYELDGNGNCTREKVSYPNNPSGNCTIEFSNYDVCFPLPRGSFYGEWSFMPMRHSPGRRVVKNAEGVVTKTQYFEYSYMIEGYPAAVRTYDANRNLVSSTAFDLIRI